MGCNHPLLYMTHGKSGRNTALKAVAVAKSSHVATVVWSLVKRGWKSWGEWVLRITRIFFCSEITIFPLYHYPQTGEGCAVCQVSPVPLDHACSEEQHLLLLHRDILTTWLSPCYVCHPSLLLCWECHQPETNFYTVVFQVPSWCPLVYPPLGLCEHPFPLRSWRHLYCQLSSGVIFQLTESQQERAASVSVFHLQLLLILLTPAVGLLRPQRLILLPFFFPQKGLKSQAHKGVRLKIKHPVPNLKIWKLPRLDPHSMPSNPILISIPWHPSVFMCHV